MFCVVTWSGNFSYPQNFQTKKLGEITVFYAVILDCVTILIKVLVESFINSMNFTKRKHSKFAHDNYVLTH